MTSVTAAERQRSAAFFAWPSRRVWLMRRAEEFKGTQTPKRGQAEVCATRENSKTAPTKPVDAAPAGVEGSVVGEPEKKHGDAG